MSIRLATGRFVIYPSNCGNIFAKFALDVFVAFRFCQLSCLCSSIVAKRVKRRLLLGSCGQLQVMGPTPEGHRAPIAELFHSTCSVDTQTPCGNSSHRLPNRGTSSASSQPESPECDKSASPDCDVSSHTSKLGTSPRINKFLAREPPDGCEKVKIVDENRKGVPAGSSEVADGVSKPSSQFVLRPSQSSAFCPLVRSPFPGIQRPGVMDPFLLNERLQ